MYAMLAIPAVIVREMSLRVPLAPHVIVFANEKGGVGKSTLAFHTCIALCHSGARVLALDLDHRQQSLATSLELRAASIRALKVPLPTCRHVVLEKQSGAMVDQEIRRAGNDVDFVVIDLPGADTATARYALAIADTIVTPVGASAYDLTGLGRVNPMNNRFTDPGVFVNLVRELGEERVKAGFAQPDWLVMKNRLRSSERRIETMVDACLADLAGKIGFRIGTGLHESVSFRDLNAYGLTYIDIGLIPALGKRNYKAEATIARILAQLDLSGFQHENRPARSRSSVLQRDSLKVPVSRSLSAGYEQLLRQHRGSAKA